MKYVWDRKKQKRKAHIVDESGRTLCKVENNGERTAKRLTAPSTELPEGRKLCGICQGISGHRLQRVREVYIEPPKPPPSKSPARPEFNSPEWRSWVTSKGFIHSWEWRELRYRVLKKRRPMCECCGASPHTGATVSVDHIKPRRKFPELALEESNLQVLCSACNQGKGNWDDTDWRAPEGADNLEELSAEAAAHLRSLNS